MAKIQLTVRQIINLGLWEQVCEYKGWDTWILNEGRIDEDDVVEFDDTFEKEDDCVNSDKGFRITCNKCENEVRILNDTSNKGLSESKYTFLPIQNDKVNIICDNCYNEVYIDE